MKALNFLLLQSEGNSSELNGATEQGNKKEAAEKNMPTTEKTKNELEVPVKQAPSTTSSSVNVENHIIIVSTSTTTVSSNDVPTTAATPTHHVQPSHSDNNVIDIGMEHSDVIDSSSIHDKLLATQENTASNRNATQANEGTNDKRFVLINTLL